MEAGMKTKALKRWVLFLEYTTAWIFVPIIFIVSGLIYLFGLSDEHPADLIPELLDKVDNWADS